MKSPAEMSDEELFQYEIDLNDLILTNPTGPYEMMRQNWLCEVRHELKIREADGKIMKIYGKWKTKDKDLLY